METLSLSCLKTPTPRRKAPEGWGFQCLAGRTWRLDGSTGHIIVAAKLGHKLLEISQRPDHCAKIGFASRQDLRAELEQVRGMGGGDQHRAIVRNRVQPLSPKLRAAVQRHHFVQQGHALQSCDLSRQDFALPQAKNGFS
ncbi:MAG: hypothetical protein JJ897_19125 [Marinibacterium sp.]|nr:hypothetical protein [Marinibacterium sp.]